MSSMSVLQKYRLKYQPVLPAILDDLLKLEKIEELKTHDEELKDLFPQTFSQPFIHFKKGASVTTSPLKVGVVLSGGQAPGGQNVISGLYDALKKFHENSRLIGFCDGPEGIVNNKTIEIDSALLSQYRNQGGFDIIGSSRTKIETPEQFAAALTTMQTLSLDGLVVIGGDDSNTNAAFLAEYFKKKGCGTRVIGVPKTIDGDLKNEFIELSFGFDTATKIYSEFIGNVLKDTLSAKKNIFFVKLMGRSASHVTLECALQTHPNMALISEEVEAKGYTLSQVVNQMADMICERAEKGKNYGAILIPEGIIEFFPSIREMLNELNAALSSVDTKEKALQKLSAQAIATFQTLPKLIQEQLLQDRDPHGNVQVSKIETERMFIELVDRELRSRKEQGKFKGKFAPIPLFCGYEGRSGLPTNFDCNYCYALGNLAALLIQSGLTGYMSCVTNLSKPVEQWGIAGVPLYGMLHKEMRNGKMTAVIRKGLVELDGKPFKAFLKERERWKNNDDYCCPGPIQFEGPAELTDAPPLSLCL